MTLSKSDEWNTEKDGSRLRQLRNAEGFSQTDLAEKVSVGYVTIHNWETGKTNPQPKNLSQLKEIFGPNAFAEDESSFERTANELGSWLTQQRVKAKKSRSELAKAANLTYLTIYNIETGKTTSPHNSTLERLGKALEQPIPSDIKADIEANADVGAEGVGSFTNFEPHDRENLPRVPGIYVLYDISERPVYVGQAEDIGKRISDTHTGHIEKFWYKSPIVEIGAYVQVDDAKLRSQIEKVMIRFLKSNAVINRQHVER